MNLIDSVLRKGKNYYPGEFIKFVFILFLKKEPLLLFFISKNQKLNEKKCEKDFLLHINTDSKCLNIAI